MTKNPYQMDRIELLAMALDYEHVLEHVTQGGYHTPSACDDCQRLAQAALDGASRESFVEMVTEMGTAEKIWVRKGVIRELTENARRHKNRASNERKKRERWRKRALASEAETRRLQGSLTGLNELADVLFPPTEKRDES